MSPLPDQGRTGRQAEGQEHSSRGIQVLHVPPPVYGEDWHHIRVQPSEAPSLASGDLPYLLWQGEDHRPPAAADPGYWAENRLDFELPNPQANHPGHWTACGRGRASLD